jgi:hypothetical protein
MEILPKSQVLAEGAISRAGNVTQNAIKFDVLSVEATLKIRDVPGIIVSNEEGR